MPPYLRPMAPTAPAAILCGDPGRALAIAQSVMVKPRMSNHNRGLWGYHGHRADGAELTVQATGIGGAGAALVLSALAAQGLRRAVRVGSAGCPGGEYPVGSCVAIDAVRGGDGASAAYGAEADTLLRPDPELSAVLGRGSDATASLISLDRLDARAETMAGHPLNDMQSAALLAAALGCDLSLGIAVVVTRGPEGPLADESHAAASLRLAGVAVDALLST